MTQRDSFFTTKTNPACIEPSWPRPGLTKIRIVAIPLVSEDGFLPETTPDFAAAKEWFLRAMSLSRKGVVKKLQALGVPEGWKKSALLRNCFPLVLNSRVAGLRMRPCDWMTTWDWCTRQRRANEPIQPDRREMDPGAIP